MTVIYCGHFLDFVQLEVYTINVDWVTCVVVVKLGGESLKI